jgi:hypothetical protein
MFCAIAERPLDLILRQSNGPSFVVMFQNNRCQLLDCPGFHLKEDLPVGSRYLDNELTDDRDQGFAPC